MAVDLQEGSIFNDREIKDRIAAERPYGDMVSNFRALDALPVAPADATPSWSKTELTRRKVAANLTLEDLELILAPLEEDAKEAVGSMGDDKPLAVISDNPRTASHIFSQNYTP